MLKYQKNKPKLDLVILFDESTGLPLLSEQKKILDLIRTYLFLPYTVAEYGCGQKCTIIIRKLVDLGIPPFAIKRGMIMEKDMSEAALKERDFTRRPHALIIENPLYHPKDFYQEVLFDMLKNKLSGVEVGDTQIKTGPYVLHHHRELQFIKARSHIFSVIIFWDEVHGKAVEYVLDPTINEEDLFEVEDLRDLLHDDEALIFTAPLLGKFRLDQRYLTYWQRRQLKMSELASSMNRLARKKHDAFIRFINGASPGSIGDPDQWTYANNICTETGAYAAAQKAQTGKGDILNTWVTKLINARKAHRGEVLTIREKLQTILDKLSLREIIAEDAGRAEKALAPLARVELIIAYFRASRQLANWWQKGFPLPEILRKPVQLKKVNGISMRLRQRIEELAEVSTDERGKLDARALNRRFMAASVQVISQMNMAGLSVFIDKVGNIHGLMLPQEVDPRTLDKAAIKKIAATGICHCSHIDTVYDAGKYDGRLGVLGGIEVAHIFADLEQFFGLKVNGRSNGQRRLMVSSFIGEEMTFTGKGVSMPGSAAVTGAAKVADIYEMTNAEGEKFVDKLSRLLRLLKKKQEEGSLMLVNDFGKAGTPRDLLAACFEPQCFFSHHTYERHIEQGPLLDRLRVPVVLVDTIMGIHQEDFHFEGGLAERGALAFNRELRAAALQEKYEDIRITVGVLTGLPGGRMAKDLDFGLRVRLQGELNHAGATRMKDRKDPGVAIARLSEHFIELIEELNCQSDQQFQPVVGEAVLTPGANRNVIPGSAAITLGVVGEISETDRQKLHLQLQSWIIDSLLNPVELGGEGISLSAIDPINFTSLSTQVLLSIDLRAADESIKHDFLQEACNILDRICREFDLKTTREIEQQLQPYALKRSGQVLQIERSYGGSHNPDEALLNKDLLIGCLMQLEVSRRFVQSRRSAKINLYELVDEYIPPVWKQRLPSFVSGALHDTCNIAARMTEK